MFERKTNKTARCQNSKQKYNFWKISASQHLPTRNIDCVLFPQNMLGWLFLLVFLFLSHIWNIFIMTLTKWWVNFICGSYSLFNVFITFHQALDSCCNILFSWEHSHCEANETKNSFQNNFLESPQLKSGKRFLKTFKVQ